MPRCCGQYCHSTICSCNRRKAFCAPSPGSIGMFTERTPRDRTSGVPICRPGHTLCSMSRATSNRRRLSSTPPSRGYTAEGLWLPGFYFEQEEVDRYSRSKDSSTHAKTLLWLSSNALASFLQSFTQPRILTSRESQLTSISPPSKERLTLVPPRPRSNDRA